nr:transposase [Methylosinus sp. H3A]
MPCGWAAPKSVTGAKSPRWGKKPIHFICLPPAVQENGRPGSSAVTNRNSLVQPGFLSLHRLFQYGQGRLDQRLQFRSRRAIPCLEGDGLQNAVIEGCELRDVRARRQPSEDDAEDPPKARIPDTKSCSRKICTATLRHADTPAILIQIDAGLSPCLARGKLAGAALESGAAVVSDGLNCFAAVTDVGCRHTAIVTGSGAKAAKTPAFKWVNTALGNIKAAIVGTYRAVGKKHLPRYLAEFEYRFNRRYDLADMIPRLAVVATATAPMLYRLLKLADFQP